ncbi:MAG TPA: hypothetical protein VLH35_01960 [Candidatus Acidoferrales bacterium]|nr:hypothetical protein [Candidatus Acidoferrales bacterium]
MVKKDVCESCGEKPAEYVLDDLHLCNKCYQREENKAEAKTPVIALTAWA